MARRLFIAFGLAAIVSLVIPVGPAHARACMMNHQCTTIWYSDATQTTQVGGLYEECDGFTFRWGTRTAYVTFDEVPC
ncbi:MAG TPA: DUF6289 family protein [Jatrophihabitantaceae bacterium]|nr:DUF6289 family protein [Jatrophihabitantaceae bacterium]